MLRSVATLGLLCIFCAPALVAGQGKGGDSLILAQFYPLEGTVQLPEGEGSSAYISSVGKLPQYQLKTEGAQRF
eukprot:7013949-Pyramimonas_sp.AAC.2